MKLLLTKKMDVNAVAPSYVTLGAFESNLDMVTPLHVACYFKRIKCIELLLSLGADVSTKSATVGKGEIYVGLH